MADLRSYGQEQTDSACRVLSRYLNKSLMEEDSNMELALINSYLHIRNIYKNKSPTTGAPSSIQWPSLIKYLDSNLAVQEHIKALNSLIQVSELTRRQFCSSASQGTEKHDAIVSRTIKIHEILNTDSFKEFTWTSEDDEIEQMRNHFLRTLRNSCAHSYGVPHPGGEPYDARIHWNVIHQKIPELNVLLVKSFCYYVEMMPEAFEGEMGKSEEGEEENDKFSPESLEEERKAQAKWESAPASEEYSGPTEWGADEVSDNCSDTPSEQSSEDSWECVSDTKRSSSDSEADTVDSEYDNFEDSDTSTDSEFSFEQLDHGDSDTSDSESTSIISGSRAPVIRYTISDLLAMRTKHADNIRKLTHATSKPGYLLNIEVEDLADTTRFQPMFLGGEQVLYIPTPSPLHFNGGQVFFQPTPPQSQIKSSGGQVFHQPTPPSSPFNDGQVFSQPTPPPSPQHQIYQWLSEDYEGYDRAKTAPTSFETGISRSTWMGMGSGESVFVRRGMYEERRMGL